MDNSNPKLDRIPSPTLRSRRGLGLGNDPMMGAQAPYLRTLCEEAKSIPQKGALRKAEVSKLIDELKERPGRR